MAEDVLHEARQEATRLSPLIRQAVLLTDDMKNTALERLFRLAARMHMDLVKDHKMERPRATAQPGQSSNTLILEQKAREKIA